MSIQQERAAKLRQERLETIEQHVKDGSLIIRQMTPAERAKYPKVDEPRRRGRRW